MEKKYTCEYPNNSHYFDIFIDEFLKDKDTALQTIILEDKVFGDGETTSNESRQKNLPETEKKSKDKIERKKSNSSYGSNIVIIQAKNDDNEGNNQEEPLMDEIKKLMNKKSKTNKNKKSPKKRKSKNKKKSEK